MEDQRKQSSWFNQYEYLVVETNRNQINPFHDRCLCTLGITLLLAMILSYVMISIAVVGKRSSHKPASFEVSYSFVHDGLMPKRRMYVSSTPTLLVLCALLFVVGLSFEEGEHHFLSKAQIKTNLQYHIDQLEVVLYLLTSTAESRELPEFCFKEGVVSPTTIRQNPGTAVVCYLHTSVKECQ
jgi:hypothetical protein